MSSKNIWLAVIGIAGIGCLIVGLYRACGSKEVQTSQSNTVTIPMNSFTSGHFNVRGPVIEMRPSGPISVWMGDVGEINYQFTTPNPRPSGDSTVSVMLASELMPAQERLDDPSLTSDVTLLINYKEPPNATRNVIKDTGGVSSRYTWIVPKNMIADGTNTVTLAVKETAQHPNGITIFGPIAVEFK